MSYPQPRGQASFGGGCGRAPKKNTPIFTHGKGGLLFQGKKDGTNKSIKCKQND